jgi:hypothetical protein
MTYTMPDYQANGIKWTCWYCGSDRTFRAGQRKPAYGADPCFCCGELRKPYVYPTEAEMQAAGCLPAPARVLRTLPPVNVGFTPDGCATEQVLERLCNDPQRTVDWDE